MAWAVTSRSLTAEAGVHCQALHVELVVDNVTVRAGFSTSTAGFRREHHSNISPYSYIHLSITLNDLSN